MIRSILAVIATYIVMTILVIGLFMGLWFGFGPNRLLKPESFDGNLLITITAPSITILCGLFGGWMCAKIARAIKPVIVLACIVLTLGMLTAYFTLQKPFPTGPRDPNMTVVELMEKGREPTWVALSNPILGAIGVLVGGFVTRSKKPA